MMMQAQSMMLRLTATARSRSRRNSSLKGLFQSTLNCTPFCGEGLVRVSAETQRLVAHTTASMATTYGISDEIHRVLCN
jgi:hypothetical protein